MAGNRLFGAGVCSKCHNGYLGRLGIFEVVPITENLSRAIMSAASPAVLGQLIHNEGFPSLRDAALHQVAKGETSLEEATRFA